MTSDAAIAVLCRRLLVVALLATAALPAFAEDLSQCMKGWALTESGDYAGALALYEACIKDGQLSDASLARTYRNIGITHRRAGEPLKAVAAYDRAIAMKPADVADDFVNRGNAHDEADQFDAALADYAQALALRPGYGQAYYNRGVAYERHKMLDKAKADFIAAYDHGLRSQALYERFVAHGLLDHAK